MGVLSMFCLFALMTYTCTCTCKGQEHTSEHVQEVSATEPHRVTQVPSEPQKHACTMCPLSTVCFFFYVPSHLYLLNVTLYTHTNVYVLSCCVSVLFESCSTVMWLLSVTHTIHYTTSLHCLVCPRCTSHTTVPVLHVTYMSTCIMQMSVLSSIC